MKKIILWSLCFLVMASGAYASWGRVAGLGVNNWMIEDDANIWLSPGQINLYPNLLWGELGRYPAVPPAASPGVNLGTQWGGASFGFELGLPSAAGLFIARPYVGGLGDAGSIAPGSDVTTWVPGMGNVPALKPQGKLDAFYGLKLSEKIGLGLQINSASDKWNREDEVSNEPKQIGDTLTKTAQKSSDPNFGLGILLADIGPLSKIDAAVNLGLPKVANTYSKEEILTIGPITRKTIDEELKTNTNLNLGFLGRAIIPLGEKVNLLAIVAWNLEDASSDYTYKEDTDGDENLDIDISRPRTHKHSNLLTGAAANLRVSKKTLVIVAGAINYAVSTRNDLEEGIWTQGVVSRKLQEYNWQRKEFSVPLNVAVEHRLRGAGPKKGKEKITRRRFLPPMVVRFGLAKPLYESEKTIIDNPDWPAAPPTQTRETTTILDPGTATTVSLGLGMKIGQHLVLDAVLQEDVLFTGGWLVSGVRSSLNTQITVIYKF